MLRYAITDGTLGLRRDEGAEEQLAARCAELAREGLEFILIREKRLGARELARVSRRVVAAVREVGRSTQVLVAGRADVALVVEADGVHLGSEGGLSRASGGGLGVRSGRGDLRVGQARIVSCGAFVSVSCHSVEEVRMAREAGASAILFAPVFGKWFAGVEVVCGVGLAALQEACGAAGEVPVFALGGVTGSDAEACAGAGAAGVAGIRMFFKGGDIRALRTLWGAAGSRWPRRESS